jgi:hypothetical protein
MIMKLYPIQALSLTVCITLVALPAYACDALQAKVEHYAKLKRQGGSAKQMNRWSALKTDYAERYRECLKSQPSIYKTSGKANTKATKTPRQAHRKTHKQDTVSQKLLSTCNFWIDAYNLTPSPENLSYRDTACRALDDAERPAPDPTTTPVKQRSLKECIKPNNVLDDEVHECMKGSREPDWQ